MASFPCRAWVAVDVKTDDGTLVQSGWRPGWAVGLTGPAESPFFLVRFDDSPRYPLAITNAAAVLRDGISSSRIVFDPPDGTIVRPQEIRVGDDGRPNRLSRGLFHTMIERLCLATGESGPVHAHWELTDLDRPHLADWFRSHHRAYGPSEFVGPDTILSLPVRPVGRPGEIRLVSGRLLGPVVVAAI